MEFRRRSTNWRRLINRKTIEFVRALKAAKWGRRSALDPPPANDSLREGNQSRPEARIKPAGPKPMARAVSFHRHARTVASQPACVSQKSA